MFIATLFFTFFLINGGECAIKKWLRNTNFNNSKNWDKGRVPCLTDTVIFPKDLNMPVELPEDDMKVYELILPSDGSLIFPKLGEILLSHTKFHGKCEGGEITFKQRGIAKWLDYENWYSGSNEATPHTERIPCSFDHVEFPPNSSFYIELPPYTTTVSTVTIQGKNLSGRAWDEVLLSEIGLKEFPKGEFVVATGEKCERKDRCDECADFPTFCRPCPEKNCEDAVKPLGFCCPICGGYLLFVEKDSKVEEVRKAVSEFPMEDVIWHVSYISGYVQVVLVQENKHFTIDKLVKELREYLLKRNLGLQSSSFRVSGSMIRKRSTGSSFGLFFGSMAFAILVAFGIVLFYHKADNLTWRDLIPYSGGLNRRFMFARFENVTGVVEIGEEQLVREEESNETTDDIRAFDNPMYSDIPEERTLIEAVEFTDIQLDEPGEKMNLEPVLQEPESIENTE